MGTESDKALYKDIVLEHTGQIINERCTPDLAAALQAQYGRLVKIEIDGFDRIAVNGKVVPLVQLRQTIAGWAGTRCMILYHRVQLEKSESTTGVEVVDAICQARLPLMFFRNAFDAGVVEKK